MSYAAPPQTPGWYQDASGEWWYWDGVGWTPIGSGGYPAAAGTGHDRRSERTEALLVWVLALVVGWLGPLVMYLTAREKPFVRHHGAEALNVAVVILPLSLLGFVLFVAGAIPAMTADPAGSSGPGPLFWAGFALTMLTVVLSLVLNVMGLMRASKGSWARLPLPFHPVRGAVPSGEEPYPVT